MIAIPMARGETDLSQLRSELDAAATTARHWARRVGPDVLANGLACLYTAYASLEIVRELSADDDAALAPLESALLYSEEAELALRTSHRLPQAARAAQIRAEAMVRLARLRGSEQVAALADGVRILANAVGLLADAEVLDVGRLEDHFSSLGTSVEAAVPRALF
jgi:hypothetical protein